MPKRASSIQAHTKKRCLAISGRLFNTAAMLSVFYALSHGKVVIVEPLVSSNPVLTLLLAAIFLKDLEALTARIITGALLTVLGTILVVTLK
jgi:drug/metabolite transporter, DME family